MSTKYITFKPFDKFFDILALAGSINITTHSVRRYVALNCKETFNIDKGSINKSYSRSLMNGRQKQIKSRLRNVFMCSVLPYTLVIETHCEQMM